MKKWSIIVMLSALLISASSFAATEPIHKHAVKAQKENRIRHKRHHHKHKSKSKTTTPPANK